MQKNKNFNRKYTVSKRVDEKNKKPVIKAPKEPDITVIIVDDQFDFNNPEGALYVPGGENINKAIYEYIKKHQKHVTQVIWTRDAHKKKDSSFKVNGGTWPVHCVEGTPGAEVDKELYDAIIKMGIKTDIFNKGTDPSHEEYGAFENCATFHHLYSDGDLQVKHCFFKNFDRSSGVRIINNNVVICGIAGDYCVKETIKNMLNHWRSFNISVLMDGVASIDGGTALNELIAEKNLKKI